MLCDTCKTGWHLKQELAFKVKNGMQTHNALRVLGSFTAHMRFACALREPSHGTRITTWCLHELALQVKKRPEKVVFFVVVTTRVPSPGSGTPHFMAAPEGRVGGEGDMWGGFLKVT